jgi:Stigma-specific protein, Stig1/Putative metal-binding motif
MRLKTARTIAPKIVRGLLVVALVATAGCSFDASANAKHGCSKTCAVCMLGFCISEGKGDAGVGGHAGSPGQGSGSSGGGDAGARDAGGDAAVPQACTKDDFCFDGPPDAATMGLCKAGMKHCENAVYGPCLGQVTPVDEQCNGQDDDCDGKADEDVAGASCTADTAQGACKAGTLTCDQGVPRCQPMAAPTAESCNGLDDDCDGTVDEGTSQACYPGNGDGCLAPSAQNGSWTCTGVCKTGTKACSGGQLGSCEGAVIASTDGCTSSGTAADDDCDGMIDENCPCIDGHTQSCYSGPAVTLGVGTCVSGTQTCTGSTFGGCVGAVTPVDETCQNQGADNDCDGTKDNVLHLGENCIDTNKKGACSAGTLRCQGTSSAAPTCVTPDPAAAEACDGQDEDCDGKFDEGFDLQNDTANCGACGTSCTVGQSCCSGHCSDTSSDGSHCGMCTTSCGSGLDCCSGQCKDRQQDESNCGTCGIMCGAGSTCCGGGCVDLKTDGNNCGACGHGCATGQTCCAGGCVDLNSSKTNCGKCGNNCGLLGATCSCVTGKCKSALGLCL